MTYPCWVNGDDPDTINQVVFGVGTLQGGPQAADPDQMLAAQDAIGAATEILHRLTAGTIHGAGMAVDEYVVHENGCLRRLTTSFKPLREVTRLERLNMYTGDVIQIPDVSIVPVGTSVQIVPHLGTLLLYGRYRLTYRFGSTVTMGARRTLLYYARQLYLGGPMGSEDDEPCQLPDRVTTITREGVTMALVDPQTFLDKGLTGLIRVDEWLASYAARKGTRGAAVYGQDAPPPVNKAVWCNSSMPVAHHTLGSL